jgi:hypothetical protein
MAKQRWFDPHGRTSVLNAPVAQLEEQRAYTSQAPDQCVIRVRLSAGALMKVEVSRKEGIS